MVLSDTRVAFPRILLRGASHDCLRLFELVWHLVFRCVPLTTGVLCILSLAGERAARPSGPGLAELAGRFRLATSFPLHLCGALRAGRADLQGLVASFARLLPDRLKSADRASAFLEAATRRPWLVMTHTRACKDILAATRNAAIVCTATPIHDAAIVLDNTAGIAVCPHDFVLLACILLHAT